MGRIEDAIRKLEDERNRKGPSDASPRKSLTPTNTRPPIEPFSIDDVYNELTVDESALRRWGPVAMLDGNAQAAKEYGQIKRPLIARAFGKAPGPEQASNLVLVTSAVAGEGKSVTALNLALSLAREKDMSVLLIDADLSKPDLSRTLAQPDAVGLSDLISDDNAQIRDFVWKTSIPRLYFMPAGRDRAGAAELLGSQRMENISHALDRSSSRTVVILDSSPLLLTNESRVLATLSGQVVLVVRADATNRLLVTEAIDLIDVEKSLGLVLNGTSAPEAAYYSGVYGGEYPTWADPKKSEATEIG